MAINYVSALLSVRICNADVLSISIYNALTYINPIESEAARNILTVVF